MNKEKRNNYNLTASFHTLEIKTDKITPVTKNNIVSNCIKTIINSDGTIVTSIINPNKFQGDIFKFSDFKKVFNTILKENSIHQYRLTRADVRLDNYDEKHYLAYAKLNKYIISALALTYGAKNNYKTLGLLSENQISTAAKNKYFQIEHYDRKVKSNITGNVTEQAKSRLELRSMAMQFKKMNNGIGLAESDWNFGLLQKEFTSEWAKRLKEAKTNLKLVQDTYNDYLIKKYYEGKISYSVQFRTLTDFIIYYQQSIFTKKQMISLLEHLGIKNAENRAKYYKKKYKFEYFSQSDIEFALKEILKAINVYFKN